MIYDVAVIGGGAAGLLAAGVPGQASVCVIEKNKRVGKKILATGNGRCNFTNVNAGIESYFSSDKEIAAEILSRTSPAEIIEYFGKLGLMHKVEDGKVYPYTNQATAVLDCLRNKNQAVGVREITEFNAVGIRKSKGVFNISSDKNEVVQAKNVVIATGSPAGLKPGEKCGFHLLESFGHSVNKLQPALVPLKLKDGFCKSFAGIKVKGALRIFRRSELIKSEEGEVLFAEYGISGIAAMQLSAVFNRYPDARLELDFFPSYSDAELVRILEKRRENAASGIPVEEYLTGAVNKKIGIYLLNRLNIGKSGDIRDLSMPQIAGLAEILKHFPLEYSGNTGFMNAQASQGGAKLGEFNSQTLESNIVQGLYAAGEALDVCGLCGGFNLHWAWVTGLISGTAAKGGLYAQNK